MLCACIPAGMCVHVHVYVYVPVRVHVLGVRIYTSSSLFLQNIHIVYAYKWYSKSIEMLQNECCALLCLLTTLMQHVFYLT